MEVKLLMGALGGPREKASAPKAPQRPKIAKNDHKSKKIEKKINRIINQGPFFG